MAASRDGRLAIAGYFLGSLSLNDVAVPELVSTVEQGEGGGEGFVLVLGGQGEAQWATLFAGPGGRSVSGVAFAPNGDVVVQGHSSSNQGPGPSNYVARFDTTGALRFSQGFGNLVTYPGAVQVDEYDETILIGHFEASLVFRGTTLEAESGVAGYLIAISANGEVIWAEPLEQFGWDHQYPRRLAFEPSGNFYLVGDGARLDGTPAVFVRRMNLGGEPDRTWHNKEYSGADQATAQSLALADGAVVVGGAFEGRWTVEDNVLQTLNTTAGDDTTDAWLLRYSAGGEKRALRAFSSQGPKHGAAISALTRAQSSFVAVGVGQSLLVDGEDLQPRAPSRDGVFVLNFGADGLTRLVRRLSGQELTAPAAVTDRDGNVWVGGTFQDQLDLGLEGASFRAVGEQDGFLVRVSGDEVSTSAGARDN